MNRRVFGVRAPVFVKMGAILAAIACSGPTESARPEVAASPGPAPSSGQTPSAASQPTPQPQVVERPEWRQSFDQLGVDGACVVLELPANRLHVYRPERVATRYVPASTFKIPNSIIALETGVASGADFTLPWDGTERTIASWNRDHDLRSALRNSVVWYYQEVARRIGSQRMTEWLARLDYGNRSIDGGIDQFWLRGGMRISPREQVAFVRRLNQGTLPISARTREVMRDIMILEQTADYALRGKTGWGFPRTPDEIGWLVGWVESGERTAYFATIVLDPPDGLVLTSRQAVTRAILAQLDLLPADPG
ncbi:MAG: class D beta-lactamase [Myxococcota bacterium]